MEQQDVVEMSRYNWDNLNEQGAQDLREYQHAWQVLGGGPCVHARLVKQMAWSSVDFDDLTPGDLVAIHGRSSASRASGAKKPKLQGPENLQNPRVGCATGVALMPHLEYIF